LASVVDICNLSLAHLGDEATVSAISPPDGSAQADHCARFYPIARDVLLELGVWGFAIKRATLALTVTTTPAGNWAYEYAMPSGVIRPLSIKQEEADDRDPSEPFIIEVNASTGNQVILTNTENAVLRYTFLVTDTTKFSPLFINCLSWLLASYLAGPITKDKNTKGMMYQMFQAELSKAGVINANAGKTSLNYTPTTLSLRGNTSGLAADGVIIR
jgi:hypothetical protein